MKSTKELEHNIKRIISEKIPNINFQDINFLEGNDNSPEGIYVFARNDKYVFLFTEKGKIRDIKEMSNETEVLWNVLNSVLNDLAMEYAISNKQTGKDFRRILFSKEIELFSLFGDDLKKRKIKEIDNVLLKNPYNDAQRE